MIIRPAIPDDCAKLLQLHSIPLRKNFLCIEKYPDYASLLQHPGSHLILVATLADGRIIAAVSAIKTALIFHGKKQTAYLLGELKADPNFSESPLLFTLVNRMMTRMQKTGVSLAFYESPVSWGITPQFPMISPDSMSPFQGIQSMLNYLLLPRQLPFKVTIPLTVTGFDEEPLKNFYNSFSRTGCLCPVVDQLHNATHFTCTQSRIIRAALSVCDNATLDIHTVVHVPGRSSPSLLHTIRNLVNLHSQQQSGQITSVLTIKYFGYEPGHESSLVSLLEHAMHFAWENKYQYLVLSTDQDQVLLNNLIKPLAKWVFRSTVMVSELANHPRMSDGFISMKHNLQKPESRRP